MVLQGIGFLNKATYLINDI